MRVATLAALGVLAASPAAALGAGPIAKARCAVLAAEYAPEAKVVAPAPVRRAIPAARRSLAGAVEAERASVWAYDCDGVLPSVGATWAATEEGVARTRIVGDRMIVTGEIGDGFARDLADALDAAPGVREVALGGPGGLTGEAMEAADAIRARGLDTSLSGNCTSACTLAFLGGRTRTMPGAYRMGYHQPAYLDGRAVPAYSPGQLAYVAFFVRMGVEVAPQMRWMRAASPEDMHYPRRTALCAAGVATAPTCPGVPPSK